MLTSQALRELLSYDPVTGQWEWRVRFYSPVEAHNAYLKASEFRAEFLPGAA